MSSTGTETRRPRGLALGAFGIAAAYLLLALAPLGLAALGAPQGAGLASELGSGLALVGFAMLLVQFVLTGRFRIISGRIGIDVVLRLHQLAARALTVILVLHPFVYSLPRAVADPMSYAASVAAMFANPAFASGVVAWVLLIVLMGLALCRRRLAITYEAWRASHGLLALVIAAAGLHHALAVGGLSGAPAMRVLWFVLAALALATLVFTYLLRPLGQLGQPWRVTAVRALGPGRWLLALEAEAGRFDFRGGQFVWLKIGRHPFTLRENPFSIVSAPDGHRVEFLIREAGDFTRTIGRIAPGSRAWIDGPHGAFTLDAAKAAPRVVMLAGGVGLAPCLSMLREAAAGGERRPFHLVFGNRSEDQIVPREGIDAVARSLDLTVSLVLSEPPSGWTGARGQMDAATLAPLIAADAEGGAVFYLCGPPPMVTASLKALAALGVPPARIVTERFDYD